MTAIEITFQSAAGRDDAAEAAALLAEALEARAGRPASVRFDEGEPVRFTLSTTRQSWDLGEGESALHLDLDRGEASAADRLSCFCELRVVGNPDAILDFFRQLDPVAPLRVSVLGPLERGERLVAALPDEVKAEPVEMNPELPAAEGFRRIAWSCIRQFRLNEDRLLTAYSPDALHQARVALRRLRSAFSIFRPMLGAEAGARLREELRWLALELSEARDLDVLVDRLGEGGLQERLLPVRARAHARALGTLRDPRARILMLELVLWLGNGGWLRDADRAEARAMPLCELAAGALHRYRRKVRKDGRDLAGIPDEERHELRKDAKKLRYASDFFAPLFEGKQQKRFRRALARLQDVLGALNDRATAPAVLERLGISGDPEARQLFAGKHRKRELAAAVRAYDELVDARKFWR